MTTIVLERAATLLASASLKSFVVLGIAALVVAVWRRSSASARHVVWTSAVGATIALPLVTALTPTWTSNALALMLPQFVAASASDFTTAPARTGAWRAAAQVPSMSDKPQLPSVSDVALGDNDAGASSSLAAPRAAVNENVAAAGSTGSIRFDIVPVSDPATVAPFDWKRAASLVWLSGFVLILLPIIAAHLRLRRIASKARVVRGGQWMETLRRARTTGKITRTVTLLESDDAAMPMTWGLFSPVLLLPAGAEEWPEWRRRNILLHELAHVERFDCLSQMVAQIACALYWFNPLVWVAARRMRVERELACDDRVIRAGSRASDYASDLLDVARSLKPVRATAHAAIAMARPSQLTGRLIAVLDRRRNRENVSIRFRMSVAAATLGVLVPVASFSPWVAEAAAAASAELEDTPAAATAAHAGAIAPAPARAASSAVLLPPVAISAKTEASPSMQTLGTLQTLAGTPARFAPTPGGILPIIKAVQSSDASLGIAATTPVAPQSARCWENRKNASTHINTNDEDGQYRRMTLRFSTGDCSLEVRADGNFTLRPDLSDVATLDRGALVIVEERDGSTTRRMEIRNSGAGIEHLYSVNGRSAPYTAEARAWLADVLLAVERRTAFAAKTRVPQLYESGGARRVLEEVSQMGSDYAQSAYLSVLLQRYTLHGPTLTRIVQQTTREMNSDYYLAEVFNRVGAQRNADEATWRAFADAAAGMKSDYYKAQVIGNVLSRERLDAATVAALLRASSSIKSDYYQAETLKKMSKRYAVTAQTRPYYVAALANISSDYYRGEVLSFLNSDEPLDAATTAAVLKSISDMKSDYYKSEALSKIAKQGRIDGASRGEYFAAIRSINSDHYKHQALNAVVSMRPLTRDMVAGVLSVAPTMKSDYYLSGLLSSLVKVYQIDDSLRPAYDRALDAIESDYYRGAVLSAARPRGR